MSRSIWACAAGVMFALLLPVAAIPSLRVAYVNELAIKRRLVVQPRVVLIGDSHIARGGVWGWRLGLDPFSSISIARGGANLREIIALSREADHYRPYHYVIEAGTNDILRGELREGEFLSDYSRLIRHLRANGGKVIVTLIPPNASATVTSATNRLNAKLAAVARGAGADIVDLASIMERDGHAVEGSTIDGVHLSEPYYQQWAAMLRTALSED